MSFWSKVGLSKKEPNENRNISLLSPGDRSPGISPQLLEDDEFNPNLYRRPSFCVPSQEEEYDVLDNRNPNLNQDDMNYGSQMNDGNMNMDPNPSETRSRTRQEEVNELIQFVAQIKKKQNDPPPTGYVNASSGPAFDYNNEDRRFEYIEEAHKGAEMNPTWRRNIFSQRPEDDDEELRQQIHNNWKFKHYHPDIAHKYWDHERYCILERRQYERDILATGGFEVGYYPYLMRDCCGLIIRYYCPPDTNLSADSVTHLYGLANYAIELYNLKHQSSYSVVNVIKAMTAVAAGKWYYLTFQASLPFYGDQVWTFEAKLFDGFSYPPSNIDVSFVRLKMEAGSSRMLQQQQQPFLPF